MHLSHPVAVLGRTCGGIAATLLLALLLACPGADSSQSGPVDVCTRAGQRCRLPGSGLGVCQDVTARAIDAREFVCQPQH